MGDRVTCYLNVPLECLERAKSILEHQGLSFSEWDDKLEIHEVNYAHFEDEEAELIKAGIPFTFEWCAGGSYSAGYTHVRFTEAGLKHTTYYEEHQDNVPIEQVQAWIQNLDVTQMQLALEDYINEHTEPPFNEDYAVHAKQYLLKKLVKPCITQPKM